jgi:Protein of unknown function (DUF2865)
LINRFAPHLGRVVNIVERSRQVPWYRQRRRTLAALMTGAALAAVGCLIVQPGGMGAAARGPTSNSAVEFLTNSGGSAPSSLTAIAPDSAAALDISATRRHKKTASASSMSGRSVCVRLCDGFFFPVAPVSSSADLAGHEATCEDTCPDAPTALYIQPSGSDKIEDAVSTSGAPYTALPVALRSRTTLDNTCACHRSISHSYSYSLLHDLTLRKGDSVMTPKGFVVFQGQKHLPFARNDFVALTQASMPNDNRATLLSMERASAFHRIAGKNTGSTSVQARTENAKP